MTLPKFSVTAACGFGFGSVADVGERPPMVHDLKCQRTQYLDIRAGIKKCEVRRNDRDYRVGDLLCLRMVLDPKEGPIADYCGPALLAQITHILKGGQFGIDSAFVVLSIERVTGDADQYQED